MDGLTRRRLLEVLGAAGAGVSLGRVEAFGKPPAAPHQAGIATSAQARLRFAALDATVENKKELRDLMRDWSAEAARLGKKHRADRLTVTIGFGPSLFDGRYGLSARKPAALNTLPAFFGDKLDPAICGGDLALQVCAEHSDVAQHALDRLVAKGGTTTRWSVNGFGRASSTRRSQRTPRNLMGFKDGTNNVAGDDPVAMRHSIWVGPRDNPKWLRGGSYLVARRIRMLLDDWNATPVHRQERVIGRHKKSGAPLGGRHEHDQADFQAGVDEGDPVIPTDAHIRLASPQANGGKLLLRRSYNYGDGLLFLAYQRNPRQFIAIQRRLGERDDALGQVIVHEGSALFACPPGSRNKGFIGDALLVG